MGLEIPVRRRAYPSFEALEGAWRFLVNRHRGSSETAGHSVEGRPIRRIEFGREGRPSLLLTGLIHGNEIIGGLALLSSVRRLLVEAPELLEEIRLTILPILNPDATAATLERHGLGRRGGQRCNAHGVDLNRNFPILGAASTWHPFSGSRWPHSPHFIGPEPFSEPETQAVRRVAREIQPRVAVGYHSFGNLLLFPWAYTRRENPRAPLYRALGQSFCREQPLCQYHLAPSRGLYPTIGDMDDWLDDTFGTLAYTVEVGRPSHRLLHPRRLLDPFWWMNTTEVHATLENVIPGLRGMLQGFLALLPPGEIIPLRPATAPPASAADVLPRAAR